MPWSDAPWIGVRVAARRASGAGQLLAARVEQGEVVEPGVAAGAARVGVLVQDEQVLAAGAHRGDVDVAAVHAQAERVLVEGDGAVEVGDGEVDGAEPQRRRAGPAGGGGSGRRRSWDPGMAPRAAAAPMDEPHGSMDFPREAAR